MHTVDMDGINQNALYIKNDEVSKVTHARGVANLNDTFNSIVTFVSLNNYSLRGRRKARLKNIDRNDEPVIAFRTILVIQSYW